MDVRDAFPTPTCAPDANHWDLKPFAMDQISSSSSSSASEAWVVVCDDDARRCQLLLYLVSQSHHELAVLIARNENSIAYFKAQCPGILVCPFEISEEMPASGLKLVPILGKKVSKLIRPHAKKNIAIIWDHIPNERCFTNILKHHCSLSSEQSLATYHGSGSYRAMRPCFVNRVIVPATQPLGRSVSRKMIRKMRRHIGLEGMRTAKIDSYLESAVTDLSLIYGLVLPADCREPISMITLLDERNDVNPSFSHSSPSSPVSTMSEVLDEPHDPIPFFESPHWPVLSEDDSFCNDAKRARYGE